MNTDRLFDTDRRSKAPVVFILCLAVLFGAVFIASQTQKGFGRIAVSNVTYTNFNGILIRAKLLQPLSASQSNPAPGIVYIHGYQNNRETGDAYCIELARRGFVVLNIDAIGRGNSGLPGDPDAADKVPEQGDFDETYGGRTSFEYLRSLPYVNADAVGMLGHSLGAEMAYTVALEIPGVNALVISGFGYNLAASETRPRNMLMIIGKWDEYRKRMTGTDDIEKDWMSAPETRQVFAVENPQLATTYGDFAEGSARRVFVPRTIHIQESHSRAAIAETLEWMRSALHPDEELWIDAHSQIWPLKEWATLVAMLACFASLLPLGLMLLRTRFFQEIRGAASGDYACTGRAFLKHATVNGLLMWLYLPLIFMLFGLHVYVVSIDKLFPMMMVNGTVWWFVWINVIGLGLFRRWFRKQAEESGLTLAELGVTLDKALVGKTALLAAILFAFAYLSEHLLERAFIVDFRFIFPFASDLTAYRALMFLLYFPFLLIGFVLLGVFLHGQLRRPQKQSRLKTWVSWSFQNTLALITPLILFLTIQYVPLFTAGVVPFVGPGGMLASFTMNLFHIIGVLILTTPISTWFYQITGKVYLGAFVNAALVTWMFTSSQVIAPIPV